MKKILPFVVIGILVFSGLGAVALQSDNLKPVFENVVYEEPKSSSSPRDYTHTVLVEVGTRTTCSSCPASNLAWHSIYEGGNYNFEYTELVYNMNSVALARFNQFNPKWVPTSYWDGGEYVYPGTNYGTFYSYLDGSGSRSVPDLVAEMDVVWLGDADIETSYSIVNNEGSNYPGRLRIYVIELVSRWNDYNGNPYYHAFLDFAVNQVIDIPAAGTLSDTIVWDGGAAGYPDITQDNIQVILAVFDDTPHQSYSDPPSGNPFNAYYSDECIAATPGGGGQNNPPEEPEIKGPTSGNAGTSYDYTVTATDSDGDNIKYYIKWGDGDSEWTSFVASGTTVTVSHTWSSQGTFTIQAKTKDSENAESGYSILEVTMPKNKAVTNPFIQLFERFQNAFPFLRQLLGL